MHWIEQWRRAHNMSREEFAGHISTENVTVSEGLIWMLENGRNEVTQHNIADRIADFTGATIAQRDSIVNEKHHGSYVPDPSRRKDKRKTRKIEVTPEPKPEKPASRCGRNGSRVLAIDTDLNICAVYPSINEAARHVDRGTRFVFDRCRDTIQLNEFEPLGITFRYADDWYNNKVDMQQLRRRADDMRIRRDHGLSRNGVSVMITYNQVTGSVSEWAKKLGITSQALWNRLKSGMSIAEALETPKRKRRKCK